MARKNICLTFDTGTLKRIESEARRCGLPKAHLVESLVEAQLNGGVASAQVKTLARRLARAALVGAGRASSTADERS